MGIEQPKLLKMRKRLALVPDNRERFRRFILENFDKVSPDKPNFRDLCAGFKIEDSEGKKIYYNLTGKLPGFKKEERRNVRTK